MLDISILNIDKEITNEKKITDFIKKHIVLEEKLDGTKLTVIRTGNNFDPTNVMNNFIFSYKNNVLIPEEYEGLSREQIKKESIGSSQYAFVVDHFAKINKSLKSIPKNTEFFIEFLMNKPTLTRDYKQKHGLVLISYSPTSYKLMNGKVVSKPKGFFQDNLDKYAKLLKLDVPAKIFDGTPNSYENLIKGSKSKQFKDTVERNKGVLQSAENEVAFFQEFKNVVLQVESVYGGKTEGVVIKLDDGKILKILQADQHDAKTRFAKKAIYKMDQDAENAYFAEIHKIAIEIVDGLNFEQKYEQVLKELNAKVYGNIDLPKHTKKVLLNTQDDLFVTAKTKLLKRLPGNNNALFIGRLQPPTKLHMKIIEDGLANFDNVVIGLVKGKKSDKSKNPFPYDLQYAMIKEVFPDVEIFEVGSGNVLGMFNKIDLNINAILAGSDRVEGYKNQLKRNPDIIVVETQRDFSGVSGTKAREAIAENDEAKFKQNMHSTSFKYFKQLQQILKANEQSHLSFKDYQKLYENKQPILSFDEFLKSNK